MCWHCREYERFERGEYKRVPWSAQDWADSNGTGYHYVHVSRHDPSLVAYTASEEHGEQDRQTRIAPGRYLSRFYGDVLSQKDIQYWCGRFKGEHQEEVTLKFASEPDEIVWVYKNGPNSCMAGSASEFDADGHHPASVYGAGDLAVAYILNDGRVTARSVCWPAKKIYGRMYGDGHTLRTKLEVAGYTPGVKSEFDGARLLRIECANGFVCPYLDIGSGRCVDDNGEYLIVGEGNLSADRTEGYVQTTHTCACPRCGNHYNQDEDGGYVSDFGEYWCESCALEHTRICDRCTNRYTDDVMTRTRCDDYVCYRCLERYYEHCEVCNEYHRYNDDVPCASEEEECASEEEEEEEEVGAPCPTITDDPRQGAFL